MITRITTRRGGRRDARLLPRARGARGTGRGAGGGAPGLLRSGGAWPISGRHGPCRPSWRGAGAWALGLPTGLGRSWRWRGGMRCWWSCCRTAAASDTVLGGAGATGRWGSGSSRWRWGGAAGWTSRGSCSATCSRSGRGDLALIWGMAAAGGADLGKWGLAADLTLSPDLASGGGDGTRGARRCSLSLIWPGSSRVAIQVVGALLSRRSSSSPRRRRATSRARPRAWPCRLRDRRGGVPCGLGLAVAADAGVGAPRR
jgi:hypothetical protein